MDEKVMNKEQIVTCKKQILMSNKEKITSNEQTVTNNEQKLTSKREISETFSLLKYIVKHIINMWNHMLILIQVNMLHIWTQSMFMDGQRVDTFFIVSFDG